MIIFKDVLTGDEMFTDSSKYRLIDDCLYEVECRHVSRDQGDIKLEGWNPSAEGNCGDVTAEGTTLVSGLDLVLNQRLIETSCSRKDFKTYLKSYAKALQDKWMESGMDERELNETRDKFMTAVKKLLPKLDDVRFYVGESANPDGMMTILEYRQVDGEERPFMLFFKHGLEEEKV